ncbi:hypothetical protein DIPPA_09696 [Diplonema papillatum]|nr:hypothetical protein DIPPA_09696 [Diplonema papillatum]
MDLLRTQFGKHDRNNTGMVTTAEFKRSLERFGIHEGLQPVLKKFGSGRDQVNYNEFIAHFQSQREQRLAAMQGGAQGQGSASRRKPAAAATTASTFDSRKNSVVTAWTWKDSSAGASSQGRGEGGEAGRRHASAQDEPPSFLKQPAAAPKAASHSPHLAPIDEAPCFPSVAASSSGGVNDAATVASACGLPGGLVEVGESYGTRISTAASEDRGLGRTVSTFRSGFFDGIDVHRGSAHALDVHRSDSGSLAAFALGEIQTDGVIDPFAHAGRRRKRAPGIHPAHQASLPAATVACLSGVEGGASTPRRSRLKRGSSHNTPVRGYNVVSGEEKTEARPERAAGDARPEGKKHVSEPRRGESPHAAGLRTFSDCLSHKPFDDEKTDSPRGIRMLRTKSSGSHFELGNTGCPAEGELQWPEAPRVMRITPSTYSTIPGLCSVADNDNEAHKTHRKGRTMEPSSFGYRKMPLDEKGPKRSSSAPKPSALSLRTDLVNKITTNSASVTRAWMGLNKSAEHVNGSGLTPQEFASAVRTRYAVDVTADDVRSFTSNSGNVTFRDFNQLVSVPSSAGDLLKKLPENPDKPAGRRYIESGHIVYCTPFAPPESSKRRSASLGSVQRAKYPTAPVDRDHYQTTNMRTYSPSRPLDAHRSSTAAGFPNRLRTDSNRRKRCISPGFSNRESSGNPLAHE